MSWRSATAGGTQIIHKYSLGTYDMVRGDTFALRIDMPAKSDRGDIKVGLECTEDGGEGRTRPRLEVVEWKRTVPELH